MSTNGEISIKKCLNTNSNCSLNELEIIRFKVDEKNNQINDYYNEIPKITLANEDETIKLCEWLNKNIKPKNILEKLFLEKTNPEVLCKTLTEYLYKNNSYCTVRSDTLFLTLNTETDDQYSLDKALELLDLKKDVIEFNAIFITEHDVSLTNTYIKWSTIKKRWEEI